MFKQTIAGVAVACVVAGQAWAGVSYTSVTKSEGGRGSDAQNMTVKALVEGTNAKMEFTQSGNPMMKAGSYILTKDAGGTMYMVNPSEKNYMKWDMEAMMKMAKGMMNMMTFSNIKVEKVSEAPGESILGYPTTHYKFRTSYNVDMNMMGMKNSTAIVREEDIWATTKFKDAGLNAWGKAFQSKTNNEQLDKLIQESKKKMDGFPLKMVSNDTTTDARGTVHTTKTTMEVTELKSTSVPASAFEIPAGYAEEKMDMPGDTSGGGKGGDNEMPAAAQEMMKALQGKK
jgi:hypothetical protein